MQIIPQVTYIYILYFQKYTDRNYLSIFELDDCVIVCDKEIITDS